MTVVKTLCCLLLVCHLSEGRKVKEGRAGTAKTDPWGDLGVKEQHVSSSTFSLFWGTDDTCKLDPLQLHTLTSCGFNSSNPLIIITHGWSLDGVMESWVNLLATALRKSLGDVNVVITDWLPLAHQHYPVAAQNTRIVGKDLAHLLLFIQHEYQIPLRKAHLIGYSLGAHISGFAGSYLRGSGKIGRITGLDPAGPLFEGMSPIDRLSPDDAEFVDAIHTFTRERMGLSVGIKQDVGHYDFYPNGGEFQPGCDLKNILGHISQYGVFAFEQTVKCDHERSVHLFIDSLMNKDKQSMAYRCSSNDAFDKGICLDCRRNRCNTLGYNIRKVRPGSSMKLYMKTGPRMPFKLYHYQFRVQFVNQMEDFQPSFHMFLTGTKDESGDFPHTFSESTLHNTTSTFLITLDKDLGDLMMLKLRWEGSTMWKNVWNRVHNFFPWGGRPRTPQLNVGKISVKAGETQKRIWFCPMTDEGPQIEMSKETQFVRCQEERRKRRRKHDN